jgi:hypothetical protein
MTCELPAPRWGEAFRRPFTVALCGAGVACTVVATMMQADWPGLLMLVGPVLFFLGSSDGVLRAHELGSLFGFVDAARKRLDQLTRECQEQRVRMRCIADQLCDDDAAVDRTLNLTILRVTREWPRGLGSPFTVYLLCRTISMAEAQARVYGGTHVHLDPDSDAEHRVIRALHDLCDLDVPHIARILDRDPEAVQTSLMTSPGGTT